MKKIILLIAVVLIGCNPDQECFCVEDSYKLETVVEYENDRPIYNLKEVYLYSEYIDCAPEGRTIDDNAIVKRVRCY